MIVSDVMLRRELFRMAVHTLDIVWLLLDDSIVFGMPTPADLRGGRGGCGDQGG